MIWWESPKCYLSLYYCAESAVSIESPNAQGSQSGPAETYDEKYISQNKEEFVKALGKSL